MMIFRLMVLIGLLTSGPHRWGRRIFHTRKGVKYAIENSQWATRLAKKLGFWGIDKDLHITRDGFVVCGHWGLIAKNGFVLPRWFTKKYGKNPRIKDVDWEDLKQLRTLRLSYRGLRKYRFVLLIDAMRLAAELGLGIMGEQKGDDGFAKPETWERIDHDRQTVGLPKHKFVAATLPDMARARGMLIATHSVNVPNMVIRAQDGVPKSWKPYMTFYRGRIKWLERR